MPPRTLTQADERIWEEYRLHQRDLLQQCFEDAHLMLRRTQSLHPEEDFRLVVSLLFDKRCAPWKYYRDEQRALVRR